MDASDQPTASNDIRSLVALVNDSFSGGGGMGSRIMSSSSRLTEPGLNCEAYAAQSFGGCEVSTAAKNDWNASDSVGVKRVSIVPGSSVSVEC